MNFLKDRDFTQGRSQNKIECALVVKGQVHIIKMSGSSVQFVSSLLRDTAVVKMSNIVSIQIHIHKDDRK